MKSVYFLTWNKKHFGKMNLFFILLFIFSLSIAHREDIVPTDTICKYFMDEEYGYTVQCEEVKYVDDRERIRFTGLQMEGKTNEDVKHLTIAPPSKATLIPSDDIFLYYMNLQSLEMKNVGLEKVDYIVNCYDIDTLNLSNNHIREVTHDAFFVCRDLMYLDLSYNEISSIHDNTFNKPKDLVELNLSFNRIEKISRKLFKPIKKLRKINLHGNNIKKLPYDVFNDLYDLISLDLSQNPFDAIDARFFDFVMFLEELNLSATSIRKFVPGTFKSLKRLKTLDISANFLQHLDGEMLVKNADLQTLKISQCSLYAIGKHFFDKVPKLATVESKGNQCFDGIVTGGVEDIREKLMKCLENDEIRKREIDGGKVEL